MANIGQSQIFHNIARVERCSSSMLYIDSVEENGDDAVLDNDIPSIVDVDPDVGGRGARVSRDNDLPDPGSHYC